jgi:hypothetical protein
MLTFSDEQKHQIGAVSENDRVWFEQHPDHVVRLRAPLEGDFTDCAAVLVIEVERGVRVRAPWAVELFGREWQIVHAGAKYDDAEFLSEVKRVLLADHIRPAGRQWWRQFKNHKNRKGRTQ